MKSGLAWCCVFALVACSDSASQRTGNSAGASTDPAASTPTRNQPRESGVGPRAPLGGQSLTGSVSGLSGVVTGFDVRRTDTQTIVDIAADVLFDFDSASLSAEAPQRLVKAAELVRGGGAGLVTVIGHTDAKGDNDYNDRLSLDRAKAVAAWLSGSGGVQADRLKPEGRGEADPIAPNETGDGGDNSAGRAKNRRVSIAIPR